MQIVYYRLVSNIRFISNIRCTPTLGNSQLEFSPTISLAQTSNTRRTLSFDSWVSSVDKVWSILNLWSTACKQYRKCDVIYRYLCIELIWCLLMVQYLQNNVIMKWPTHFTGWIPLKFRSTTTPPIISHCKKKKKSDAKPHISSVAHCSRSQDIDLFKFQLSYCNNPLQDTCPITFAVLEHLIRTHVLLIFLHRDKKSYRWPEKCATLYITLRSRKPPI